LAVNVKTENASFRLDRLTVHGTFLTEAHVVAGPTDNQALASFWAKELNVDNWGWRVINGTCKRRYFQIGKWGIKQCGDLRIEMAFSSATFGLGNWTVTVRGNHVYDWISGPKHRLDVSFNARGDAPARSLPHGIIGQSFSSSSPRHGRVDEYPEAGRFTTSAMAEGAIEGEAALYEMPHPHATHFAFSRFDEADESTRVRELGAHAATVEDVQPSGAVLFDGIPASIHRWRRA